MEQVIVTVKREGEMRVRDIELSAGMPAQQFIAAIAQALGWDLDAAGQRLTYEVEAIPPGRVLRPEESLAQAGVWDGAMLIFRPQAAWIDQPAGSGAAKGQTGSWRSLETPPASPPTTPPAAPSDSSSGFVWKRIDED